MPKTFISFRVANAQTEPVCEQFARSKSGIRQLLDAALEGEKVKALHFGREVKAGQIIEEFANLYVITCFDERQFFVPEISEYDQLKATLAFGLKAHKFGISAVCALRIFSYYLLSQNRFKDALKLLRLCPEQICAKSLIARIKDPIDLLAIVMDNDAQYLTHSSDCEYYSSLIKLLLLQEKKPALILEFASFFYEHKKARSVQDALKLLKKV